MTLLCNCYCRSIDTCFVCHFNKLTVTFLIMLFHFEYRAIRKQKTAIKNPMLMLVAPILNFNVDRFTTIPNQVFGRISSIQSRWMIMTVEICTKHLFCPPFCNVTISVHWKCSRCQVYDCFEPCFFGVLFQIRFKYTRR